MRASKTTFQVLKWAGEGHAPDIREMGKKFPLPQVDLSDLDDGARMGGGWVGHLDLANRYDEGDASFGVLHGIPWMQVVGIRREAPASLVAVRVAEISRSILRERGSRYLARKERQEIKERVQKELDAVAQPTLRGVDVIQVRPDVLVVCTGSDKIIGLVSFALHSAFRASNPGTWKLQQLATTEALMNAVRAGHNLSLPECLKVGGVVEFRNADADGGDTDRICGWGTKSQLQWMEWLADGMAVAKAGFVLALTTPEETGSRRFAVTWKQEAGCVASGWAVTELSGKDGDDVLARLGVFMAWLGEWPKMAAHFHGAFGSLPPGSVTLSSGDKSVTL